MWRRVVPAALAPWLWFVVRDTSVAFELVAVLLPLLVVVAFSALAALSVRWPWLLVPAASVALVGFFAVIEPWIPHDTGTPARGTTIVVANVLTNNHQPAAVVDDILSQDADIAVVPESTQAVDELLADHYPYEVRANRRDAVLGVYSRVPIRSPRFVSGLLDRTRQARIEVDGPDGPFVLWAVHLPKPWLTASEGYEMKPGGHARKLDAFLDAFSKETLPLVVAGDTNLTDRGRGYHKMTARFDDALRGIWGGPTGRKWYLRPLLLRIDHVFMPKDWCADRGRRFDLSGSDHRGVRVRVGPCRGD